MNTSENKGTGKTMAMIGYIVAFIVVAFIALMVWGHFAQKDGYGRQKVDIESIMPPEGAKVLEKRTKKIEVFTENDKKILETTINLDNDWNSWTRFVPEADVLTRRFMVEVFEKNLSFDKDTFRFIFLFTPLDNRAAGPQKVMSMDFTASEMRKHIPGFSDGSVESLNMSQNVVYLDRALSEKMIVSFCEYKESNLYPLFKPFCDAQLSQLGVQQ